MPKRTRRLLISFIVIASIAVGAFLFSPSGQSRWQSLFPKVAATGDEFTVASRTLAFSVNATGVLRATSLQNFGAPPEFGNYWQFQIVSLAAEGKQVKSGDPLIGFDAIYLGKGGGIPRDVGKAFERITPLPALDIKSGDVKIRTFRMFLCTGFKGMPLPSGETEY